MLSIILEWPQDWSDHPDLLTFFIRADKYAKDAQKWKTWGPWTFNWASRVPQAGSKVKIVSSALTVGTSTVSIQPSALTQCPAQLVMELLTYSVSNSAAVSSAPKCKRNPQWLRWYRTLTLHGAHTWEYICEAYPIQTHLTQTDTRYRWSTAPNTTNKSEQDHGGWQVHLLLKCSVRSLQSALNYIPARESSSSPV